MSWPRLYILFTIVFLSKAEMAFPNVYILIHATLNGKTGHAAIAIDNYDIMSIRDAWDTVANGTVTYYDLWPVQESFRLFSYSRSQEATYYTLPNGIWPQALTIGTLYDRGPAHRIQSSPDGILMIRTTPAHDFNLVAHISKIISEEKSFNPRFYNCTDFVLESLAPTFKRKLRAHEFMPFTYTATPNKLYHTLRKHPDVHILKDPESKVNKSFIRERVLKRKRSDFIAPQHNQKNINQKNPYL